jgi:hypothetical protein
MSSQSGLKSNKQAALPTLAVVLKKSARLRREEEGGARQKAQMGKWTDAASKEGPEPSDGRRWWIHGHVWGREMERQQREPCGKAVHPPFIHPALHLHSYGERRMVQAHECAGRNGEQGEGQCSNFIISQGTLSRKIWSLKW